MNKREWIISLCKRQKVKGKNQSEVGYTAMLEALNLIAEDVSPEAGIFAIMKKK